MPMIAWGRMKKAPTLTLFTTPKPFRGHFALIQRNAIESWSRLENCEVILQGDEEGTADEAKRVGATHLPEVARSTSDTPLISALFRNAAAHAQSRFIAYINADILLLPDFLEAFQRIPFKRFLMVGQRWNLNVTAPIDFSSRDWETNLRATVQTSGILHDATAIDYFVFPKDFCPEIPDFSIGRPAWDNWMIYHARATGVPAIDATGAVTAIHQNHDYSHHPNGFKGVYEGPEAKHNLKLAGGWDHIFTLQDTNWKLGKTCLRHARPSLRRLRRQLKVGRILLPHIISRWIQRLRAPHPDKASS